ncbi:amidohydrolase family protein [Nocardia sp. GCM10030253]|uniref:amidohydrolase family protein n=1 Tax=Nocardia sp. GCM10030253 TaxID=3273404 RepID=UPI0036253185
MPDPPTVTLLALPERAVHSYGDHAGSDAGMTSVYVGAGLIRELELLVAAGLTPREVIIAATATPAAALGKDNIGVIAPGRAADLVVTGNPLTDIANLRRVDAVLRDGATPPNPGRPETCPRRGSSTRRPEYGRRPEWLRQTQDLTPACPTCQRPARPPGGGNPVRGGWLWRTRDGHSTMRKSSAVLLAGLVVARLVISRLVVARLVVAVAVGT